MDHKKVKPPARLLLTDITIDPRLRVRDVDEHIAAEYAENVEAAPPVVVWDLDNHYVLLDGHHRLRAHQIARAEYIRVLVLGGPLEEAKLHLAQCDARVGLRRNRAAKRIAIKLVLGTRAASGWSDRKIGAHTGTSHTLVAQVRAELACRGTPESSAVSGKIATGSAALEHPEGVKEGATGKIATEAAHDDGNSTVGKTRRSDRVAQVDGRGGNLARQKKQPAGGDEDERRPCNDHQRDLGHANLEVETASDEDSALFPGVGKPGVADVIRLVETVLEGCADDDERRDALVHLLDTLSEMHTALDVEEIYEPNEGDEQHDVAL